MQIIIDLKKSLEYYNKIHGLDGKRRCVFPPGTPRIVDLKT